MGIIKQGILGGFLNKVGSVVGTSWKGRAVMKAMPLSVANPRTASQVSNRNQMSKVVKLASAILSAFIIPLLNRAAGSISGYNLFVKLNKSFYNTASSQWTGLVIAQGKLTSGAGYATTPSASGISVTWSTSVLGAFDLPTDLFYMLVINATTGAVIGQRAGLVARSAGTDSVTFGTALPTGAKIVYACAFLRADGTMSGGNVWNTYTVA